MSMGYEFYYDDVAMMSFINMRYGNVAVEIIPEGHLEQPSVIHLLWAKNLAQMLFSLRCVQYIVTSILQDRQYMFGVRSLLVVEKVLLMRKNLVAVLFRRRWQ